MSLKRIRIFALIFALLAGISIFFIYRDWSRAQTPAEPLDPAGSTKQSVVVALVDIKPYTTITAEMLEMRSLVVDDNWDAYFTSLDDVLGKITRSDVYQGEILSGQRVVEDGDVSLGLAFTLEEGMRAVTVNVDTETGVASMLKVGNYVDLIYMNQISGESTTGQQLSADRYFEELLGQEDPSNLQSLHEQFGNDYTIIAMQKLKVAAVDSSFYKDDTKLAYASVTFEVTPKEAASLALLADGSGAIRLILRPQDDETLIDDPRGVVIGEGD